MILIHLPVVTLAAAGLLGLIFAVLSIRVVRGRIYGRIMLGDGASSEEGGGLLTHVRTHANFAEYVPLCLLLSGGLEMRSGPTILVKLLATALVLARLAHPVGMVMKPPNPFRAGGFAATLLVLLTASLAAIVSVLL